MRIATPWEKVSPDLSSASAKLVAEHLMEKNKRRGPEPPASRMQQVIDDQAAEIGALRGRLAESQFAEELKNSLVDAAAAGAIAAPLTHPRLLELIVETAMQVVAAEAGALFLLDEQARELSFEVALGPHASAVRHLRVPLGHGIAGLVAYSGQPIIVADAGRDPRQASDIARIAGYTPRSILCVPLLRGERVIGVLELLDKHGSTSFAPADMEISAPFAEQAAVAIEQSLAVRNLSGLLAAALANLVGRGEDRAIEQAQLLARQLEETPLFQRTLELAGLVREIAGSGDAGLRLCEGILRGVAEYLRSRPAATLSGLGV